MLAFLLLNIEDSAREDVKLKLTLGRVYLGGGRLLPFLHSLYKLKIRPMSNVAFSLIIHSLLVIETG